MKIRAITLTLSSVFALGAADICANDCQSIFNRCNYGSAACTENYRKCLFACNSRLDNTADMCI